MLLGAHGRRAICQSGRHHLAVARGAKLVRADERLTFVAWRRLVERP
jgi:hypothetical protein